MLGTSTLIGTTADGAHDGVSGGAEAAQPNTNTSIMTGGEDEKAVSQSSGGGGGGGGSGGGDLFESDRSTGGNRWPRQETLALLKIRSDMDVIFRDSSLKGPLWEEVSRKMGELGYHRSAKKCKEKFENVYKYHKRTKDGRVGKSDGKTYRFFDQLEALEQHHMAIAASQAQPPMPQSTAAAQVTMPRVVQSQGAAQAAVPVTMVIPAGTNPASVTVPSSPHPISVVHTSCSISAHPHPQVNVSVGGNPTMNQVPPHLQSSQVLPQQQQQQQFHHHQQQQQQAMGSMPGHSSIQMENASSPSATQSSSSTSSDEELIGRSRKRKRKWKDFFEKLMKEVIEKQEELQKKFLEAVEKREHDRVAREESWKTQEMNRLNREHEILVQERSTAAAKDAALISFLQKLSDQQQIPLSLPAQVKAQPPAQPQPQAPAQTHARAPTPVISTVAPSTQPPQPQPQPQQPLLLQPQSQPQPQPQTQIIVTESQVSLPTPTPAFPKTQPLTQVPQQQVSQALVVANTNNGDNGELQKTSSGDNHLQASSSRWPKAEVQALINLRTNLDQKYQENGPKGPLWEEISGAMKKLGYNRNAKRCKEKWENINKYFKKVKESNKKRPEDSKTCPYFHQLDALYRERNKMEISGGPTTVISAFGGHQQQQQMQHEIAPMMVQPEQQWPHPNQAMEDQGSENQEESDDEVDDEDDDDHGSGYEIVANNNNNNNVNAGSMSTTTAATRTATTE